MTSDAERQNLIEELLARTSRTFALAIPLLPKPVDAEVAVAYLLFRVADTIEDATQLTRKEKAAGFDSFIAMLSAAEENASMTAADPTSRQLSFARPPCDNSDYLELLDNLPVVFAAAARLRPSVKTAIFSSVRASASGMKRFVSESNHGDVQLHNVSDLREYCYYVAGIVGEMLTEIFLTAEPKLSAVREELETNARSFGEGLQLVNMLKDSEDDSAEGRRFIPREVDRREIFKLARNDLERSARYVDALRQGGAAPGIVAFTDVPLQLAWQTLDCVEKLGPGSKITRAQVEEVLRKATQPMDTHEGAPNRIGATVAE